MSDTSELIGARLELHNAYEHRAIDSRMMQLEVERDALRAQLADLDAKVAAHLSSYHAAEAEENKEEEEEKKEEDEEEEEDDMTEEEKPKEASEEKKPKAPKKDTPPVTNHVLFRRFNFGGKRK